MKTLHSRETKQIMSRVLQQYVLLVIVYMTLIFLLPPSLASMRLYHLSALEYRIVLFAVALPGMVVWLAAFIGYATLRQYAYAIRKTPEGIHFDRLAEGCMWLAWSLPVGAIIPLVVNAMANNNPDFHPTAIIISNYVNLILPLIAFSIIANASRGLLANAKINLSLANARIIIAGFLLLGVLYCFFTFRAFDLSSLSASNNPYFLPIWLMVLTVIVPYLFTWFIGVLATYEITLFSRHAKGVFYKQALTLLAYGFLAVILSSIALQYINSVEPRVGHLVFNYRLALNSLFRIVGGVGFALMALAAIRLKKIEEV